MRVTLFTLSSWHFVRVSTTLQQSVQQYLPRCEYMQISQHARRIACAVLSAKTSVSSPAGENVNCQCECKAEEVQSLVTHERCLVV